MSVHKFFVSVVAKNVCSVCLQLQSEHTHDVVDCRTSSNLWFAAPLQINLHSSLRVCRYPSISSFQGEAFNVALWEHQVLPRYRTRISASHPSENLKHVNCALLHLIAEEKFYFLSVCLLYLKKKKIHKIKKLILYLHN